LRKVYPRAWCCGRRQAVTAIENLSFGLNPGECFALLGVNGAGKSSTFKSLTCEIQPTEGKIEIAGQNINSKFGNIKKLMGYCPQ
jgi:ATP-binding cassette subfamily A (ABC1) protein 3